jgi:hypothetical protein
MRLPRFATTTQFCAGFVGGLLLFVAANVHSYRRMDRQPLCSVADGWCSFGFPFEVYGTGGFITHTDVFWSGIVANTFIAVTASVLAGALCRKLTTLRRPFA